MRRKEQILKKEATPITVLLIEQQGIDDLTLIVQKVLESSTAFTFQIERAPLKTLKQDVLKRDFSEASNTDPQLILLLLSGPESIRKTVSFLGEVKQRFLNVPILAIVDTEKSEAISQLMEKGVDDFVTSPIRPDEILLRMKRLLDNKGLEDSISQSLKQTFGLKQLIGQSSSFVSEIKKIPILAQSDAIVFITGETGTGKELCARAIHYLSPRSGNPFIPVNCGAIPLELVENELFGHEKGAFTGAVDSRTGLIEEAEGGTVFLDEIDCLPPAAQVKLLRFLQEKEYRPLGSKKMKKADVRLLAAMNIDLQEAVAEGKLRRDLYYRLNVIPLAIPPLRERRDDIPLLARHFLEKYSVQFNKTITDFSAEAIQLFQLYDWPGNVRELEHYVERTVVLSEGRIINAKDVILPVESDFKESFHDAKNKMVAAFEKTYIERLLLAHHGNISQAARAAQKNRRAFWELVRKHQIDVENFKT
jgi:two-component system response regulator GlrR